MKLIYTLRFPLFAVIIFAGRFTYAQIWEVPEARKSKLSPIVFNQDAVQSGEATYNKYCVSCHGNPGQNNSLKTLKPVPPDPASEQMQKNLDGEIMFKITEGRAVMPSFKNVLSEDERWKLIAYIRSFNKKYVQPAPDTLSLLHEKVRIHIDFNEPGSMITVYAKAAKGKDSVVLADAEATVFVKRYFGNLQIDSLKRTGADGKASFRFPNDLPGDTAGMVDIFVRLNHDTYGEITAEKRLKAGLVTRVPGLTEQRAIWNVVVKAPWWIIITYTGLVLVFWAFLLYIIAGLLKIKKLGKSNS